MTTIEQNTIQWRMKTYLSGRHTARYTYTRISVGGTRWKTERREKKERNIEEKEKKTLENTGKLSLSIGRENIEDVSGSAPRCGERVIAFIQIICLPRHVIHKYPLFFRRHRRRRSHRRRWLPFITRFLLSPPSSSLSPSHCIQPIQMCVHEYNVFRVSGHTQRQSVSSNHTQNARSTYVTAKAYPDEQD